MLPSASPFSKWRTGKGGQIAVAGTVDEDLRQNGAAAGFGFEQQRLDPALAFHRHAGGERVEKDLNAPFASSRSSAAHL